MKILDLRDRALACLEQISCIEIQIRRHAFAWSRFQDIWNLSDLRERLQNW